jgi:2-dehydro-3-deoxyphosphogluconate aldolase / (4S)-4-hydroxy-2-oxoglutarate aldolase
MADFAELFAGRIVAILRGMPPAETVRMACRAWDLGVDAVEVPIGREVALPSLVAAVAAGRERGEPVGAGTVITREQVIAAVRAGAAYTVAPGFDQDVCAASTTSGLPHLPGVATATEIQRALAAGCRWVKAFPARTLGQDWFRDMRGPFPDLQLVAVGGVNATTAAQYLAAGARAVGIGSALADRRELASLIEAVRTATPPATTR